MVENKKWNSNMSLIEKTISILLIYHKKRSRKETVTKKYLLLIK